jgi:hypothetical protein
VCASCNREIRRGLTPLRYKDKILIITIAYLRLRSSEKYMAMHSYLK